MNAADLLQALGNVKDSYIIGAWEFRQSPKRKHLSWKRVWLTAAIIAIMLLLVGCAVVYAMRLRDMKIGESTVFEKTHYGPGWEVIEAKEKTFDVLSVQGFADSPNQKAVMEWRDYLISIEHDNVPVQDKQKKLEEIAGRYGLKLLSDGFTLSQDRSFVLLNALQLSGVCTDREYAKVRYGSSDFHPEGTFRLRVDIELDEERFDWPYFIYADYQYYRKGYFKYYFVSVENLDTFQEWEYTMPDGGTALLALGEKDALILAEREDGFFCVSFDSKMGVDHMTKELLEKIADLFDFSIQPHSLTAFDTDVVRTKLALMDKQEQQERLQRQEQYESSAKKEGYALWVREILSKRSAEEVRDLGYAFFDIDGNGAEDLLIGRDGYCTDIFWEVDGKTEKQSMDGAIYYLCEDQVISYVVAPGLTNYFFTRFHNGTSQGLADIKYTPGHPEGEYWKGDMEHWNRYDSISKEEFDSIMASFVRIPISFLPLTQYPLEETVVTEESDGFLSAEQYSSYEEKIRIRLTDMEERWPRWKYDIRDLNGDGVEEMIWQEDDRQWVYTMHGGKVSRYRTVSDGSLTVCADGIIEAVHHYGPVNKTYRWYRLESDRAVLVEYLRYDVDRDPENPWFRSPDLTGQDITLEPVSEKEAMSILARHTPLEVDMKPIASYPFGP